MSAHTARALLILLTAAPTSAFAVDWVGVDGSNCEFDSIQDALNDPSTPPMIFVAEGIHEDPGFVIDRDVTVRRADSSCVAGGTSNALIDFLGVGSGVIEGDAVVTLNQLTLANGVATTGGNLRVDDTAVVVVNGGSFLNGDATDGGGVAVLGTSSLEINGAVFTANTATDDGGGLFAEDGATVVLNSDPALGLYFVGNAAADGGGVMCHLCDLVIASPLGDTVLFQGNEATDDGGGLMVFGGTLDLTDATFDLNIANDGGGILLNNVNVVDFSGLDITDNEAAFGGGLRLDSVASLAASDLNFDGNTASGDGGAIFGKNSEPDVDEGTFTDNSADRGGAVFLEVTDGAFEPRIRHGRLIGNTASSSLAGSGVDVRGAGNDFSIANSEVVGGHNPSSPGAALVAANSATLTVKDSTVAFNQRYGVATLSGASGTITGSIVYGNGTGGVTGTGTASCSDIQGLTPSGDNISADPQFVDPSALNFDTLSTSPVRDACAVHAGTSLNGVSRSVGASDMGAFDH